MPADANDPHDEAYHAVLEELSRITQAWTTFREVMNRAIGLLNNEVFDFQKRIDTIEEERKKQREKDDIERATQRASLDAKLTAIERGLNAMRAWQYVRVGVEIAAVLIVLALLIGKVWL